MKKMFILLSTIISLFVLVSCGDGYKECKSVTYDNKTLSSSESKMKIYEYVNALAEIDTLYATEYAHTYLSNYGNGRMLYKNNEYAKGKEIGEMYIIKTTIRYNEKDKKAIEIVEKYLNISIPGSIYDKMQKNEIFVPNENIYYYENVYSNDMNKGVLVSPVKATYDKVETNFDLSGSPSIQYIYA